MNKTLLTEYNQYIQSNLLIDEERLDILKNKFIEYKKKEKKNNKFHRPRGRGKKNMVWDGDNGGWINENKTFKYSTEKNEYANKKYSELKKLAINMGINQQKLDDIDDEEGDPKKHIIQVLNENRTETEIETVEETKEDNKIIFEGVKYCFVNETNEVFNIEGAFELMGIWDNNKILFDEGMEGIHNSNK